MNDSRVEEFINEVIWQYRKHYPMSELRGHLDLIEQNQYRNKFWAINQGRVWDKAANALGYCAIVRLPGGMLRATNDMIQAVYYKASLKSFAVIDVKGNQLQTRIIDFDQLIFASIDMLDEKKIIKTTTLDQILPPIL